MARLKSITGQKNVYIVFLSVLFSVSRPNLVTFSEPVPFLVSNNQ